MKRIQRFLMLIVLLYAALFNVCRINPGIPESEIEQKIFQLVNNHRLSKNLTELIWNNIIHEQCRIHSSNMALDIVPFSHEGFEERSANILKSIPFSKSGENIAYLSGYPDPAETAVKKWLENDEHKKLIEGNFTLSGIGVAKNKKGDYYITQIFIKN